MNPFGFNNPLFGRPAALPAPEVETLAGGYVETQQPVEAVTEPAAEPVIEGEVLAPQETFDVALAVVVEEAPIVSEAVILAAEPKYPAGAIDFNKPFIVVDANDEDDVHTDARIVAVLAGNSYPVVIVSNHDDEEVIHQFDTDGDELNGYAQVIQVELPVYPRTIYVLVDLTKSGKIMIDGGAFFDSYDEAVEHLTNGEGGDDLDGDLVAIMPITVTADDFKPINDYAKPEVVEPEPVVEEPTDDVEGIEHDDDELDVVETEQEENGDDAAEALPEGAVWVNGIVRKPGDKVTTYRTEKGERRCTILKTRNDPFKSLYVQADNGTEEPYWARNKNVRHY